MTDKVTPIRTDKGTFQPGVSGNPHGVSATRRKLEQMKAENDELLSAKLKELVPFAAKLHRAMLKATDLSNKEKLELIKLTYEYGHGKPRQAEAAPKHENGAPAVEEYSPEMLDHIESMIAAVRKGAKSE